MQVMAAKFPALTPEAILRMATVNGARALGRTGELGELTSGAWADMIAILDAPATGNVFDAILANSSPVVRSWIAGEQVWPDLGGS
jgi:5-methylthioadenosine/S-adenosylhomocysteine deaminase